MASLNVGGNIHDQHIQLLDGRPIHLLGIPNGHETGNTIGEAKRLPHTPMYSEGLLSLGEVSPFTAAVSWHR